LAAKAFEGIMICAAMCRPVEYRHAR
jgi:hypothetical protein